MKKKIIIPMTFGLIALIACGNVGPQDNSKHYEQKAVSSFVEKKDIRNYLFLPGMGDEYNRLDCEAMSPGQGSTSRLCFFNGSTIPYLSVDEYVTDYLNALAETGSFVTFSVSTEGSVVTVKNPNTNGTCIFDFEKGTCKYPSHNAFTTAVPDAYGPGDYMAPPASYPYFVGEPEYKFTQGTEKVINFVDYNIQGYMYEGKGYLPYYTLSMLLTTNNPLLMFEMYYNGKDIYTLTTSDGQELVKYYEALLADDTTLNAEYMQYNYDTLALMLDYRYGMKRRYSRVTNKYIDYLDGGAYKLLEPYKKDLLSQEANKYDLALGEIAAKYLDDGGHTTYSGHSILQKDGELELEKPEQRTYTLNILDKLVEARSKTNYTPSKITGVEDANQAYSEVDGTAFLTFDQFTIPATTDVYDPSTYYKNTIFLTRYANEMIREHHINNVVIDLSCNPGGIVIAEEVLESWLTGGAYHSIELDTVDNSVCEISYHADVDGDGKFTTNDYLPTDMNICCIVTPASFSCGNLLPSRLSENSNCHFIGDRSGGGCCTVDQYRYLPVGGFFTLSSSHNSLKKSWSVGNYVTVDDGVTAESHKIPLDEEHIAEYFDYPSIAEIITPIYK